MMTAPKSASASPKELVKVGIVIGTMEIGGLERINLALVRSLNGSGVNAVVIAIKHVGSILSELEPGEQEMFWSPGASKGIDWAAIRRTARYIDQTGLDVVMANNQYATIFCRLALLFCKRNPKLICASHSLPDLTGRHWKDRLQFSFFRWSLRRARCVVFVSETQQSAWQQCGALVGLESLVIHNGVDLASFANKSSTADRQTLGWTGYDFVVGLCAQMRPEKRIQDLIAAASVLLTQGVRAKILLIGDGPERHSIEQLAAATLPAGTLHITGYQKDVAHWMQLCDVMALVSETEAFSMVVLEAMACHKPVVLSNVGGAREQIEHGVSGYLYPAGSVEALSSALKKIATSGNASVMGGQAYRRVCERFSLSTMTSRYKTLFLESK